MAQWTCETIDPEFEDAQRVAFTEIDNNAKLMMGEILSFFWDYFYWTNSATGLLQPLWDYFGYDSDFERRFSAGRVSDEELGPIHDVGNIPLVLIGFFNYYCEDGKYCPVNSFDISFKVGDNYKRYHSVDDFYVSYKYLGKEKNRNLYGYIIKGPRKEFWSDFKAANSVTIRVKHKAGGDYQYFNFNMAGSTKAYSYVTKNQKIVWLEDWMEEVITFHQKQIEQEEKEREEALLEILTPHKFKYECMERRLILEHPNFEIFTLSEEVKCDSFLVNYSSDLINDDSYNYWNEWDTLLNTTGLCYCDEGWLRVQEKAKRLQWGPDGMKITRWAYPARGEVVEKEVPFDNISQYDWDVNKFCKIFMARGCCDGSYVIDTLEKYRIEWKHNPLKMIVSENNKTKEFVVKNWSVNKGINHGTEQYEWDYYILSDDGKEYSVVFIMPMNAEGPLMKWETNIGKVLLFDHWQIPENIYFKHMELFETDFLKIVK